MLFIKIFLPILMFVIGACLASFGNVLVSRYPDWSFKGSKSYSVCEACGHRIAWYDLFPLISYICLGGKCRYCKKNIPLSSFLVELFSGLMFLGCYFAYVYIYPNYNFVFDLNALSIIKFISFSLVLLILLCSSLIDFKFKEAPFSFSLSILCIALINWGLTFALTGDYLLLNVLGFVIPLVLFALIYLVSVLVAKVEPIGITDIIVYCALGLMGGIYNFIIILLISSLTCAIKESIKIKKTGKKEEIPFLPYIFAGFVVSVYFGQIMIDGYLKLIGV